MAKQREEGKSSVNNILQVIDSAKSDVSKFTMFIPTLTKTLEQRLKTFQAGKLTEHLDSWKSLTNDKEILDMVTGTTIDFHTQPVQHNVPLQKNLTPLEGQIIDNEVSKLLSKGVIVKSDHEDMEFISPIFLRPKKDGSNRMILNLKALNKYVQYYHFKMETLMSAVRLMTPNCYMSTIDLKDAYYSVPIRLDHQKYLSFRWKGSIYKFVCFPNGLSLCPRKFTKLLKPLFACLRQSGCLITSYIDDNYIQGSSHEDCVKSVLDTISAYSKLGFYIHPEKSILYPSQEITYLGFTLNSVHMTVKLTNEKAIKIQQECISIIKLRTITIRQVARLLGLIVSSFPGVMWGPLHYRKLEGEKINALAKAKGNFDAFMQLSPTAKDDISWWASNVRDSFNVVSHGTPGVHVHSDASKTGWGGTCNGVPCGGPWTPTESELHINVLEIKAAFLTLKCYAEKLSNKHVRINIDNMTAVSAINHMGTSHSLLCNQLASELWSWCIEKNIWLSAAYIPGKDNVIADYESRRKSDMSKEWMLDPILLRQAFTLLNVSPDMDLFASRLNNQFSKFASYRPEPGTSAVDAFTLDWENINLYAFPPFSVASRVLQKLQDNKATGIIVLPNWPTQVWFSKAMRMLIQHPVLLQKSKHLLKLPSRPSQVHPLSQKLSLLVCHLSGNSCKVKDFHKKLQTSSYPPGGKELKNNIKPTWISGQSSAIPEGLILFQHL